MLCPKCGSDRVSVQAVAENKKRGCFMVCLWIFLACTVIGLLILIPLLSRKGSKVRTWAVCQRCGYRWLVKRPSLPKASPISPNEPRFDTLVPNVQQALSHILNRDICVSENEGDWVITKSGLTYSLNSRLEIGGAYKDADIKIYFPDDTYDTFYFSQLRIGDENIEV